MRCYNYLDRLDDYVDDALPEDIKAELERHVESCADCGQQLERVRTLRTLLQDYGESALPEDIKAEYFDQTLMDAAREGARQQRNRWLMAGFGAAVAAGLATLVVAGL